MPRLIQFFQSEASVAAEQMGSGFVFYENDSRDVQRNALVTAWDQTMGWLDSQLTCLEQRGLLRSEDENTLRSLFVLSPSPFRVQYQRLYNQGLSASEKSPIDEGASGYGEALDLALQGTFPFRPGNRLEVQVDGKPYHDAVIDVIHNAKRFVHLSSLHLANDRFGQEIAAELIAKKMGFVDGPDLQRYLDLHGWRLDRNADEIKSDFVRKRLQAQAASGGMPAADLAKLLQSESEVTKTFLKLTQEFEIRLLLDLFTVRLAFVKNADIGSGTVVPVLRQFGADVSYVVSFIFFVNHSKFVASENEAVLGGGNFIDKVANWDWSHVEFHDMSFKVHGPLVNDLNRFFIDQFNKYVPANIFGRIIDFPGQLLGLYRNSSLHFADPNRKDAAGEPYYYPPENEKPAGNSEARLVYAINEINLDETVNAKAFEKSIRDASQFVFIENPFFTYGPIAGLLERKAREWNLRKEKEENGEIRPGVPIIATCDMDTIRRRPGHRGVVVILPKFHDQPLVKLANNSLIDPLLQAGVDVCKWNGGDYNQHAAQVLTGAPSTGASTEFDDLIRQDPTKGYVPDAMLHSKVWTVDGKVGYIGSSNLTLRSQRGDLELGIVTTDPAVVADIDRRILGIDLSNSEPVKEREVNYLAWPLRMFFTYIFPVM